MGEGEHDSLLYASTYLQWSTQEERGVVASSLMVRRRVAQPFGPGDFVARENLARVMEPLTPEGVSYRIARENKLSSLETVLLI